MPKIVGRRWTQLPTKTRAMKTVLCGITSCVSDVSTTPNPLQTSHSEQGDLPFCPTSTGSDTSGAGLSAACFARRARAARSKATGAYSRAVLGRML
eukprot:160824-Amphidinium_carterae.1